MDIILAPLGWLFWFIFITGPLWMINGLYQAIEIISGDFIMQIIFGVDKNFNFNGLPVPFYGMLIFALFLIVLFFIVNFCFFIFRNEEKTTQLIKISIKNSVVSVGIIFIIPALFFIFNLFVSSINKIFPEFFGTEKFNIADLLYWVGNKNGIGINSEGVSGSTNGYLPPSDIWNWYWLVTAIVAIAYLIIMFLIIITIFQKMVEIFFLFIISPVITVTMTFDNGKRIILWKDFVIAKFITISVIIFGNLLFAYLLTSFISLLGQSSIAFQNQVIMTIIVAIFVIGGSLGVMGFGKMVASFVGENASIRESAGSLMKLGRLVMLGAGMGAGAGFLGAAGKGFFGLFSSKLNNGSSGNGITIDDLIGKKTGSFKQNISQFSSDFKQFGFGFAKNNFKANENFRKTEKEIYEKKKSNLQSDISKMSQQTGIRQEDIITNLYSEKLKQHEDKMKDLFDKYKD